MRRLSLTALLLAACPLASQANLAPQGDLLRTSFTYTATVPAIPPGTRGVNLWLPIPSDGPYQKVTDLHVDAPVPYKITTEHKYGNRMLFLHSDKPMTVAVSFTVDRSAIHVLHDLRRTSDAPRDLKRYLKPDKLVPVDGRYAGIAHDVVGDSTGKRERLLKIFNHVVATMQYDYNKESPELGKGDVAFVCDYKKGNCSDLHSYLISLARAQGVPTYLEYGFPITGVPVDQPLKKEGTIGGYHCWTWAYDDEVGWMPLDASDARRWSDKGHPDLKSFLFGNLVLERSAVAISKGRDLDLSPKQRGPALNNFIYPYAEADGKPVDAKWELKYQLK